MPENEIPADDRFPDPASPFFADLSRPDFNSDEMIAHISWQQIKQELGQEIVEFQLLETNVKLSIGLLLDPNDPNIGRIVTAGLEFRRMLGLLYALFCHRHPNSEAKDKLKNLLNECDDRRNERNQIVHSYWEKTRDGGGLRISYTQSRPGKSSRTDVDTVLSETLRAESDKCSQCVSNLRKFAKEHFSWVSSRLSGPASGIPFYMSS